MASKTGVRKPQRVRLARAELLIHLAITAQGWADIITGDRPTPKPFDEWPDDDPLKELAVRYDLTGNDLARIITRLAGQLEDRAMRTGYEEAWL